MEWKSWIQTTCSPLAQTKDYPLPLNVLSIFTVSNFGEASYLYPHLSRYFIIFLVYACTVLEIVLELQKQKYCGVPGYCINILGIKLCGSPSLPLFWPYLLLAVVCGAESPPKTPNQ